MDKIVCLSYQISEKTQMYKDTPTPKFLARKSIETGDASNDFQVEINNHSATHIDAPAHFVPGGKKIGEYTPSELEFSNIEVIDARKKPGEWVELSDFEKNAKNRDADCLLIITGFCEKIGTDEYRTKNPGISPETIAWARQNLRKIRAIGIDSISVSSQGNSARGREAHRLAFEEKEGLPEPILLIEGMDLKPIIKRKVKKLHLFPWFGGKADSSPCTIIAEI